MLEDGLPVEPDTMLRPPAPGGWATCRRCGCWEYAACWDEERGSCWWAEPDLCSHCAAGATGNAEEKLEVETHCPRCGRTAPADECEQIGQDMAFANRTCITCGRCFWEVDEDGADDL